MLKVAFLLVLVAFATAVPTPAFPKFGARIDPDADWRIVGGNAALAGAYPFIVSLRSSGGSHFCGGSILNNQWILTAAHCIIGHIPANIEILAGTNTLNSGGQARVSNRIVIHASYSSQTVANDIGVVGLSSELPLGGSIVPITRSTATTGAVAAILIGWGRLATNGAIPNDLQYLNTTTLTHAQCQTTWGASVSPLQICALTQSGQGSCHGDSGGPLIQNSNRYQLGILSFRHITGCAVGWPDVYVRISSYNNWINSAIAS